MQKFRVWELAKQYNKTDKDIISTLKSHNVEVKSHLSVVDEKTKQLLDRVYAGKPATGSTETKAAATKSAAAASPSTPKQPRRRRPARTVRFDQQSGKPKEEFLVDGKGRKLETKPKVQPRPQKVAAKQAAKSAPAKQVAVKRAESAKKQERSVNVQQHGGADIRRSPQKKAQPTVRPEEKLRADEGQRSSRPVEKRAHKAAQRTQSSSRNMADHNAVANLEEGSGKDRGGRKANRNQRRN
ncbi:MAG: translation initiation factor IF-2 N-terminal domain-containing protein [Negativicoccus succinicivorans]|nr:translation initiation factor IF-2 N-terminal domain-containing protein [Negativicoccus succinicivorans]MDU5915170.1 translation initiation factor IF-2 N-terminal domain-containing protein [Negativicoccus succinicivorans]